MSAELRPPPPGQDLLRVSQVAPCFGVCKRTVLAWLKAGKLRGGQTPGGHWRVPAATVRELRAQFGITDDGSG